MFYGVGGTVLPSASGLSQHASVAGLSPTAGDLSRYGAMSTKYGQVPFKVSQTITASRLAKGIGAIAGGPLGVGLLALSFTADWLSDSGLSADSSGAFTQQVTVNTYKAFDGRISQWYTGDIVTICNQVATSYRTGFNDPTYTVAPSESPASCNMLRGGQNYAVSVAFVSSALATQPITPVQFETALLAHPRTVSEIEKILSETIKYPEIQPDPVDWVRIDPINPGDYIKSPTKTDQKTTTNPDGSKIEETKSCWIKGTVQTGASLKLTEVCNTDTVTKSPSGTVTGTTTATTDSETADAATPKTEDGGLCDTLIGKLICTDLGDAPTDEIPKVTKDLSYTPEVLFGSGSCPADKVVTLGALTVPLTNMPQTCGWLADFVKPLAILLATFSATLIVIGAPKE